MEKQEEYKVDKSKWARGPWDDEPDRVDWVHCGLACMARRHPQHGHWCGYVGVPNGHRFYGKPYDEVEVEFHGGLTYADRCRGHICHVPAPGMPADVWWLGGDFGHFQDIAPGMEARLRSLGISDRRGFELTPGVPFEVYRAWPYVKAEVESLAEQLAAMQA